QISFQVATACKRLLSKSFEILSISSLHKYSQLCTKVALFYIHTCTHSIEKPFTQTNNQTWIKPKMDFFIFNKDNKNTASFQNTTPTNLFHKVSCDTEEEFMKLNNTETKNKRKAYYFYKYFKAYLTATTKNDKIIQL
ncbi:18978_t:CDS:2, partial [Gigaspora margarita]